MENSDRNCELTILMPCLNEEKTIEACVKKAMKYLNENSISGEVLVADNGSTDNSATLAEALGARVITVENKGYGSAVNAGNKHAYGRYIIMADSDDSYDFSNLNPFVERLRQGYDFVIGNRFKGGIEKGAMPWHHKYIGNPVLSWIGRRLYHCKIGDFHCGLRGYDKEKILSLNLQSSGMELASEMIIKVIKANFKIVEIPIKLYKDGRNGKSHLRSFRDGMRHLRVLFKLKKEGRE